MGCRDEATVAAISLLLDSILSITGVSEVHPADVTAAGSRIRGKAQGDKHLHTRDLYPGFHLGHVEKNCMGWMPDYLRNRMDEYVTASWVAGMNKDLDLGLGLDECRGNVPSGRVGVWIERRRLWTKKWERNFGPGPVSGPRRWCRSDWGGVDPTCCEELCLREGMSAMPCEATAGVRKEGEWELCGERVASQLAGLEVQALRQRRMAHTR